MTIADVESRTGLTRANIRFYEREGLLHPERQENGYRNYTEANVETLLKIKLLRKLSVSLEDIRAIQAGQLSLDGYLRGVPFFWPLEHLWPLWLFNAVVLLAVFALIGGVILGTLGAAGKISKNKVLNTKKVTLNN